MHGPDLGRVPGSRNPALLHGRVESGRAGRRSGARGVWEMATAMIGWGTARILAPEPLCHALSRVVLADAILRSREIERAAAPAAPGQPREKPSG